MAKVRPGSVSTGADVFALRAPDPWPEYLHLVEVVETTTYLIEWRTETPDHDEAVAEADGYSDLHEERHHRFVVDATLEAQHPWGGLAPVNGHAIHPVLAARLLRWMGAWVVQP